MKHQLFQILPLAISFGIGYWILISANIQQGKLKGVGEVLGWILIITSFIVSLFSFYFSSKIVNVCYTERVLLPPVHHFYIGNPIANEDTFDNDDDVETLIDLKKKIDFILKGR